MTYGEVVGLAVPVIAALILIPFGLWLNTRP